MFHPRQQGWRSKGQGVQAKESRYDEFFSNLDEGRHVARSVSDVLPVAGSRYLAGDRWNVRASADKTRHGDAKLTHITAYAMLPALQGARGNHVHRMEEEENAGHAHGGSISLDNGLTNRHLPSGEKRMRNKVINQLDLHDHFKHANLKEEVQVRFIPHSRQRAVKQERGVQLHDENESRVGMITGHSIAGKGPSRAAPAPLGGQQSSRSLHTARETSRPPLHRIAGNLMNPRGLGMVPQSTRPGVTVEDDLEGLPPEIAAARLKRKMKEQVWSGFQLACEGLYIGGVVIACRDGVLEEAGVTHILNVTPNEKNFFPDRFVYKRIAVDDDSKAKLDKHFNECYSFINNAIQGGGKVFTHCSAGVSRSSTVVIYFLMRSYKLSLKEAYRQLKAQRGCIAPNFNFWSQLVETEMHLYGKNSCSLLEYKVMRLIEAFPSCDPHQASDALKQTNGDVEAALSILSRP